MSRKGRRRGEICARDNRALEDQIRCPFYRTFGQKRIGCEGIAPGTVINLQCETNHIMLTHIEGYCADAWEHCEIARCLEDYVYGEKKVERNAGHRQGGDTFPSEGKAERDEDDK